MIWPTDKVLLHEDNERGLSISARPDFEADFLALLQQTEFGTAGVRYRRLGLEEQLRRLRQAVFVELRERGRLLGTYALTACALSFDDQKVTGIYRGLLAVAPHAQGKGLGRHIVERTFDWLGTRNAGRPTLTWGCIESQNSRSRLLLQSAGARKLGSLESLLTYRQWPRKRIEIEDRVEAETIAAAFEQSRAGYGVTAIDTDTERYFAVSGEEGIVAGARATLTHVDMLSAGGVWDLFYEKIMRRVPAARRRYDPRNFRYLRLTDIIVRPGYEQIWGDFVSTLLARHEAYMAMFLLDPQGSAYLGLEKAGLFGRFAASTKQRIDVLAMAWNMPADRLAAFAEKPLAIGPLDI